ncbi:MAG TPA: NADH-quinone oxidoreductase subunit L [Terracidiphilus sp.]|nr:NADH-quinone oxidoreductase subunit L [Terracidiphilus sp.]
MNGPLHLWLIPLLPFAGFLLNGLLGRKLPKAVVSAIALLAPLGAFVVVLQVSLFTSSAPTDPDLAGAIRLMPYVDNFGQWIHAGSLHVDFSFVFDQLSLVMLLVVTGVGFLIHIYSVGYMGHEEGYWRYFAYLNLFLFFMTVLVLAGNALLMFVGWEGVGLASYLLIGFWYHKQSAANAGMKAFVVNRIGDFGFLIGIFLLLANFGTLTFSEIAQRLSVSPYFNAGIVTATALCLLVGATGKSAQLPLYVWLPDAMEGPTPVSALIHAATMVTAGVYMIARTHFLFDRSPLALSVVAIIGAATALFAATIGMVQTDIKRVLAYSTISQLGYMFLGCGVAAYSAAIFHLVTHAFFKALLFLAAGSVIHGLGGEQDMRKMGGLRRQMPITFWTMTAAVLAISGAPGLSGFFSKDAILASAFAAGGLGKLLWFVGVVTAMLTAFYMFRLWYLTFMGESRNHDAHAHESPLSMTGPLVLLALLSVCGGWIAIGGRFYEFLSPVTGPRAESPGGTEYALMGLAVLVALIGWFIADQLYRAKPERAASLAASFSGPYKLLLNKYYVDDVYSFFFVKGLLSVSKFFLGWIVDFAILGGIAWLLAGMANLGGAILQRWQSGNLRSYAAWLTLGAAAILLFVFVPWTSVLAGLGIHLGMVGQ